MRAISIRALNLLVAGIYTCLLVVALAAPHVAAQTPPAAAPAAEPVEIPAGKCGDEVAPEDCDAMFRGYQWWDTRKPNFCAVSASGSATITGDNARDIWNFFVGHGLTPNQAAGIMGNFAEESGFDPRALQPNTTGDAIIPKRGYGIAQWTSDPGPGGTLTGRQKGLADLAAQRGKPVYDLAVQLDYVWYEITVGPAPYNQVLNALKSAATVEQAVQVWENLYEIHAGPPQPSRVAKAYEIVAQYGSNTPGSPTTPVAPVPSGNSSNNCNTGSGQVVGGFALPLDRMWYDQHKDWFTKPHHDHPAADIPVPRNTPVYSMTGGKVLLAPNEGGYGKGVTIDAGNGIIIAYGHGTDGGAIVHAGDTVTPGQLIMHVDNTGNSQGDHLHVDIRINGVAHCPQNLFVGIAEGNIPNVNTLPTSGCTN